MFRKDKNITLIVIEARLWVVSSFVTVNMFWVHCIIIVLYLLMVKHWNLPSCWKGILLVITNGPLKLLSKSQLPKSTSKTHWCMPNGRGECRKRSACKCSTYTHYLRDWVHALKKVAFVGRLAILPGLHDHTQHSGQDRCDTLGSLRLLINLRPIRCTCGS
jgi:hypothetical protein